MELQDTIQREYLINSRNVKSSYNNFVNLHNQVQSGVETSVDKFLHEGLLVALNRHALGIPTSKGKYYNLLFKWTESLTIDSYLDIKKSNMFTHFNHSLFLLENRVPIGDRKKFGEHYTPREIVDFIINKTINKSTNSTLDPAVGSGAFLVGWLKYQLKVKQESRVIFTGYDINPTSLAISELNLDKFLSLNKSLEKNIVVRLEIKDSLKEYIEKSTRCLFNQEAEIFDAVIGNPPYVRVQNIQPAEKRDLYRASYPESALGRFDLYMLFIEMGGRALNECGHFGYIVSNKLMTSNAAKGVRGYISNNFDLEHVIDLGDSKLFQAAVLPMILIAKIKGSKKISKVVCANVREVNASKISNSSRTSDKYPLEILEKMKSGKPNICCFQDQSASDFICSIERVNLKQSDFKSMAWYLNNSAVDELIKKIRSSGPKLGAICKTISAGIKSTADDVFCKPVTDKFIEENQLEIEYIHPYLQAKNITKWSVNWSGKIEKKDTYVIYPHREENDRTIPVDLSDIPKIALWLEKNKPQLARRKYVLEAGRRWYEIWVPQKISHFTMPYKIITPDFSTHNQYALDTNGYWCGGNAFMIIPENQDKNWVLYILGLMNSSILEYFHKKASSTFIYAGRYRYTATAISKYPIPQPGDTEIRMISGIAKELIKNPSDKELSETLDSLVADLYKFSKKELERVKTELGN